MIFYILNSIVYLYVASQFFHIVFPEMYTNCILIITKKVEKLSVNILFNGIYYYSKMELLLIKTKIWYSQLLEFLNIDLIKEYIQDYMIYDDNVYDEVDKNKFVYVIKNGMKVKTVVIENNLSLTNSLENEEFDFLILNCIENNDNILYKKINDTILNHHYKKTNYTFIQIEIILENTSFLVSLHNPHYNFYIKYNYINANFILYFLKTYYQDKIMDCTDDYLSKYKIKIIDQNVNVIQVDNTDELVFGENNYFLVKNEKMYKKMDILEEAENRKVSSSMKFNFDEVKEEETIEVETIEEEIIEDEYIEVEK